MAIVEADGHVTSSDSRGRNVSVVRVVLEVIVDPELQLFEWKVRSVSGEPRQMTSMFNRPAAHTGMLTNELNLMRSHLAMLLSEHVEDFDETPF